MFRRLCLFVILVPLVVTLGACRSTKSPKKGGGAKQGTSAPERQAGISDRDDVELALLDLVDDAGVPLRLNLGGGQAGYRARHAHILRDVILIEGAGQKPRVYALERDTLKPRWTSHLVEPSRFPATENRTAILLISEHYAHALSLFSGAKALRYIGGALNGLERPHLRLPFTPTSGAGVSPDTFYLASLGSPDRNKTLESFSLISGQMGWGFRTQGLLNTTPIVGGDPRDPRLYFVDSRGVVTCLDANNYGIAPAGVRWQALLDNGVKLDPFLSDDVPGGEVGSLYIVDNAGVLYCLDRATGERRWSIATGVAPRSRPRVFGDVCVVGLADGLAGFDKDNVVYELSVSSGADEGKSFLLRTGKNYRLGAGADDDLHISDRGVAAGPLTC